MNLYTNWESLFKDVKRLNEGANKRTDREILDEVIKQANELANKRYDSIEFEKNSNKSKKDEHNHWDLEKKNEYERLNASFDLPIGIDMSSINPIPPLRSYIKRSINDQPEFAKMSNYLL